MKRRSDDSSEDMVSGGEESKGPSTRTETGLALAGRLSFGLSHKAELNLNFPILEVLKRNCHGISVYYRL